LSYSSSLSNEWWKWAVKFFLSEEEEEEEEEEELNQTAT
jgi:hypothetical protein